MAALVEAGFGRQVAMLVAGVINSHLMTCNGDPCDGCCPLCCAPCSALLWFRTNTQARLQLAYWFQEWDTGWDWCLPDGQIAWTMIDKHWQHQCPACGDV